MKLYCVLVTTIAIALSPTLACAQTAVRPPKMPAYNELKDDLYDDQPLPQQPAALQAELMDLTQGSVPERVAKLKRKVLKDLVYLKGGTFMMGDFGPLWIPGGGGYYTAGFDNKPPHKVTLTGFSLLRYKATYAELDVFADATRQPRAGMEWDEGLWRHPLVPAGMFWQRAKDYCAWLGQQTGLPFDLPTEAQWEYAARSGGQFFVWATDNGSLDRGRNIASYKQEDRLKPVVRTAPDDPRSVTRAANYPVGIYPPNPIGIYDMNADGDEWIRDWYDANYYSHSPERDPKGPDSGTERVVRGQMNGGDYRRATNVVRLSKAPRWTFIDPITHESSLGLAQDYTVRCAVNLDRPISKGH